MKDNRQDMDGARERLSSTAIVAERRNAKNGNVDPGKGIWFRKSVALQRAKISRLTGANRVSLPARMWPLDRASADSDVRRRGPECPPPKPLKEYCARPAAQCIRARRRAPLLRK